MANGEEQVSGEGRKVKVWEENPIESWEHWTQSKIRFTTQQSENKLLKYQPLEFAFAVRTS